MSSDAPREPRSVAFFLPDFKGGGAERALLTVAGGVAEARPDWRVHLVVGAERGPLATEVDPRLERHPLGAPTIVRAFPALVHWLRRTRPDAIVSTLPHTNVASFLARRLAAVPTRAYGLATTAYSLSFAGRRTSKTLFLPAAMRLAYPLADRIVTVSDGVARDAHRFLRMPRERFVTLYDPVVDDELPARAARAIDHPWLQGEGPPVILSAGRLAREKDFPSLLRAFASLRAERPARLIVLGEGPLRPQLEAYARELGVERDVDLPGFVSNPFAYMGHADAYALTSLREGLPNALIQAMACGCPVVSTDCPGGVREILEDGRVGRLVPVGDPEALAEALARTLDETPDATALIEASNKFSKDRTIRAWVAFLEASPARRDP